MLKVIFGFLGLVLALAVVSSLMKTQLGALGQLGSSTRVQSPTAEAEAANSATTGSMAGKAVGGARLDAFGATAGIGEVPSAQAQIQGVQQNVRDRTVDALQKGVERSNKAQP